MRTDIQNINVTMTYGTALILMHHLNNLSSKNAALMSSFISQKAGEFSELHAKNTGGICVQDVIRTQMKTVNNNVQCLQSGNTQSF